MKLTEIQVSVNKLEADMEETRQERAELMQDDIVQDSHRQNAPVPRGSRSAAIPVTDSRATTSAPATAPAVPSAPASTPPAQTSAEVFADAAISTPTSTQTGAASRARSDV